MFLMTQTFCFVSYTIRKEKKKRKRNNLTCSSSLILKEKKIWLIYWQYVCLTTLN